jgi:hypothetical protein
MKRLGHPVTDCKITRSGNTPGRVLGLVELLKAGTRQMMMKECVSSANLLVEARTDADVEAGKVAWVNTETPSEEIGDIPMTLAGNNLGKVMKEVQLTDGSGVVPIQLMWSNAMGGPEGPIAKPH